MSERSEFETAPSPVLDRMPALVLWAEQWLAIIGGVILLVVMIMTSVDVAGRYIFNSPLGFAYEMTELLMALVVFTALAPVTLRGEHITIRVFNDFWQGRVAAARELVIAIALFICSAFLSYRMFLFTGRFLSFGDITTMLKFPLYPVAAIGAVGIGLAALAALILIVDAARRLVRSSP